MGVSAALTCRASLIGYHQSFATPGPGLIQTREPTARPAAGENARSELVDRAARNVTHQPVLSVRGDRLVKPRLCTDSIPSETPYN